MTDADSRAVRVGDATVTVKETTLDGAAVVILVVDCRHSTTQASVIVPDTAKPLSEQQIVSVVCQRALAETPCACVRELIMHFEIGGF